MRELEEFLTEREIYILENHPQKSYSVIGKELGVSPERVRQIKFHAQSMLRNEKRAEQLKEVRQTPVSINIVKSDLSLIIRALEYYSHEQRRYDSKHKQRLQGIDPDIEVSENLINKLKSILSNLKTDPVFVDKSYTFERWQEDKEAEEEFNRELINTYVEDMNLSLREYNVLKHFRM